MLKKTMKIETYLPFSSITAKVTNRYLWVIMGVKGGEGMVQHTTYKRKYGIVYAISHGFHAICLVFSLFLVWGIGINLSEGVPLVSMIHIIVLLLFAIFGAGYRDTWRFDVKEQRIYSFFGFAWWGKQEDFHFDEVIQLQITHFVKGTTDKNAKPTKRRYRAMVVFSLVLTGERTRDLQIIAEKTSAGRTEAALQAIAAVTELPMFVDRSRDMDLNVSLKDL